MSGIWILHRSGHYGMKGTGNPSSAMGTFNIIKTTGFPVVFPVYESFSIRYMEDNARKFARNSWLRFQKLTPPSR